MERSWRSPSTTTSSSGVFLRGYKNKNKNRRRIFSTCCRTNAGLTPAMPNVGLVLSTEAPVKGALLLHGFLCKTRSPLCLSERTLPSSLSLSLSFSLSARKSLNISWYFLLNSITNSRFGNLCCQKTDFQKNMIGNWFMWPLTRVECWKLVLASY